MYNFSSYRMGYNSLILLQITMTISNFQLFPQQSPRPSREDVGASVGQKQADLYLRVLC